MVMNREYEIAVIAGIDKGEARAVERSTVIASSVSKSIWLGKLVLPD